MKKLSARERIKILSGRVKALEDQLMTATEIGERGRLSQSIDSALDALRTAEREVFLERCERGVGK